MLKSKLLFLKKIWKDIIEAIGGTEQDFTKGSMRRAIFLLSVPMVLEMLMESVFAVADIFFVSKLGAEAIATVGLTESVMTIVYSIAVGLSTATTAIVARRIGEKNNTDASVSAVQGIISGIGVALIMGVPGIIWAKEVLDLMGASDEILKTGSIYTTIMFGSNIVIVLLFVINAIFRAAGDAAISMRVLWIANVINIILDPCLIFGWGPFPELGIKGAAIATTIGRGLAVLYQLWLLFRGKHRVKIEMKDIKINFSILKNLIKISLGGIGQHLVATSSWIFLIRIVSEFGSIVMAGYTIALRIIIFGLLPSFGLSNAASTLVGQNLGAKQPKRAEKSVWQTSIANVIFMGLIGFVFVLFPERLMRLFIDDMLVIEKGIIGLRVVSCGFIFYALGMVMANALNGAGDTITPTVINVFCYWLLELPLAYLLSITLRYNENGVYYAIVFSEAVMALTALIIFKRGKWKTREV